MAKNLKKNSKQKTLDTYVTKTIDEAYLNLIDDDKPQVNDPNTALCEPKKHFELMTRSTNKTVVSAENCANTQVNDSKTCESAPSDSAKIAILEEKCAKLESQNKSLIKDNKALKKLLGESKSLILYKDLQLKKLNEIAQSKEAKPVLFEKHNDKFTEEQLFKLRSISKGKIKDSEFMNLLVDILYGEDVNKICVRQKKGNAKTAIPKGTMNMIGEMLSERVNAEGIPQQTVLMRCSRLNRLVGDGIYYNSRKKRLNSANSESKAAPTIVATTVTVNNELKPIFNDQATAFMQPQLPVSQTIAPHYNPVFIPPNYNQNSYYAPYPIYSNPYPYNQSYPYPYNQSYPYLPQ